MIPDSKFQIPEYFSAFVTNITEKTSRKEKIMAKIEKFEDLAVWKLAFEAANLIYDFTSVGTFSSDYALRDQI